MKKCNLNIYLPLSPLNIQRNTWLTPNKTDACEEMGFDLRIWAKLAFSSGYLGTNISFQILVKWCFCGSKAYSACFESDHNWLLGG